MKNSRSDSAPPTDTETSSYAEYMNVTLTIPAFMRKTQRGKSLKRFSQKTKESARARTRSQDDAVQLVNPPPPDTERGRLVESLNRHFVELGTWDPISPSGHFHGYDPVTGRPLILVNGTDDRFRVHTQSQFFHIWTHNRRIAQQTIERLGAAGIQLESTLRSTESVLSRLRRCRQAYQDYLEEQGHFSVTIPLTDWESSNPREDPLD
jgi:hypothetical protein